MSDYSALAQRVSLSIAGIRGCLMLSRDGLILGAHPEGEPETDLRAAWVRFAGVGDPERSYVEFPDQIWAFVRRGSYAAFAVADVGVRPGVLVDTLEQALLSAEQERVVDRDAMRLPEAPSAPSGKPRTSLHMPDRQPTPEPEPATVRSRGRRRRRRGRDATRGRGRLDAHARGGGPPGGGARPSGRRRPRGPGGQGGRVGGRPDPPRERVRRPASGPAGG